MKKIILSTSILFVVNAYSQTIPTSTVTGSLKINDSLNVTNNIRANGDMTAKGEVTSQDTLHAQKDILVSGNAIVQGDLNIKGNSSFTGNLLAKQGILFDNTYGLKFYPATASMRTAYVLGGVAIPLFPPIACPNPNTNALPLFINNGSYISRVPAGTPGSGLTNSSLSFYSAPWDGSGIIEVDGLDKNGLDKNVLLLNYFCGRNTGINVNFGLSNSGKVGLGRNVEIGPAPENLLVTLNINAENKNGIKLQSITAAKAFVLTTNNTYTENFIIYGNGKTRIGTQKPLAPHDDAMLGVDGKVACKSLYVLKPTSWADFVFKKRELENLKDVENYILANKHLPNIPSEEDILKNGYDINEMDAKLLEKIETLYLHIIELEKEIKKLKTN